MKALENKTVFITGASSGIGRATALLCAKEGANTVVADVMVEEGMKTVEMIKLQFGQSMFLKTDVASEQDVKAAIQKTVETYGALDCAVNNAGIEGATAATHETDMENWNRVIGINLTGVWLCMKYEIPVMLGRGGSIVNMSSVAGIVGFRELPAYVASKHGVIGLTRTAALEYAAQGLRVNAVCPGVIKTPMVDRATRNDPKTEAQYIALQPIGRMGTPEEIAEAVVWLCSDKSSFVTGHALIADGGLTTQ